MSDKESVGLPPTFKQSLKSILARAASQDRTVIEFRTNETESGGRHLSHAIEITDHVDELERRLDQDE